MKKVLLVITMCLGVLTCSAQTVSLEKVASTINEALEIAQNDLSGKIKLKNAKVTLQATTTKTGGGGFKIFFKASKKWSKERSSSITYSYTDIKRSEKKGIVSNDLAEMIVAAAREFESSTSNINGLQKDSFTVEISFAITNVTAAGVEIEFFGVAFDGAGENEVYAAHTIELEFGKAN